MPHELNKILICTSQPDYKKSLKKFRSKMMRAARFADYGSEENQQVIDIIRNVAEHGDKAVAEYTEKFDGVKLRQDEFRVSQDELDRANQQIDQDILLCLREAVENVRAYQKDILINQDSLPRGIRYTPIKRIGVCVPGASAPLKSP